VEWFRGFMNLFHLVISKDINQLSMKLIFVLIIAVNFISCHSQTNTADAVIAISKTKEDTVTLHRNPGQKIIHVFVALCDNKYQGIVPVPKAIGNGQDPANNLYWGCSYGVKTYFKNSKQWQFVKSINSPQHPVLERCIFRHKNSNTYLVADAYDGQYIRNCTKDFLKSCAGLLSDSATLADGKKIYTDGNADLLAYVGHDGLMDFSISEQYNCKDTLKRETIILACISKKYFAAHLKSTNAKPLIWSTGLMSPEAYTLHDAIESWIGGKPDSFVRESAAKAYSRYQQCSDKAAKNLLVSGW